jgi:hypothetical protein
LQQLGEQALYERRGRHHAGRRGQRDNQHIDTGIADGMLAKGVSNLAFEAVTLRRRTVFSGNSEAEAGMAKGIGEKDAADRIGLIRLPFRIWEKSAARRILMPGEKSWLRPKGAYGPWHGGDSGWRGHGGWPCGRGIHDGGHGGCGLACR